MEPCWYNDGPICIPWIIDSSIWNLVLFGSHVRSLAKYHPVHVVLINQIRIFGKNIDFFLDHPLSINIIGEYHIGEAIIIVLFYGHFQIGINIDIVTEDIINQILKIVMNILISLLINPWKEMKLELTVRNELEYW